MKLPILPPYPPMEARLVSRIPIGKNWVYEPKWDGFRCIIFRDRKEVELQSKGEKPLGRYFPEVIENVRGLDADAFVLDGEIVLPVSGLFSFDDLLQRIHPAESRIKRLAWEHPATLILFDLLVDTDRKALVDQPFFSRRERLELFASDYLNEKSGFLLSESTRDAKAAEKWLESGSINLDGVVAKRGDLPYQSGERTGMQKIKKKRTADCVVGGFRYSSGSYEAGRPSGDKSRRQVGSLLLGLYDREGILHHVGFCSGLSDRERTRLLDMLEPIISPPGFTGRSPGGHSRWSTERSEQWQPLEPKMVVEVEWDHFTGGRFRHGTKLLRMRPDKPPRQCTMDQIEKTARATDSAGGNFL